MNQKILENKGIELIEVKRFTKDTKLRMILQNLKRYKVIMDMINDEQQQRLFAKKLFATKVISKNDQ